MIDSDDNSQTMTFVTGGSHGIGRVIQAGYLLDGNYLLQEMIGRGGMGCVFKARHMVLNRDFAVKLLSPDRVTENNWKRFEIEGRAIAKLDHTSIVKVYNMGVDKGDCLYYAMDLLEGDTLSELCDPGASAPISDVLKIFRDIADGLSYAHRKGIIHRDIKPTNIILIRGENNAVQVKIVDFGIAKLLSNNSFDSQSETKAGEIFGSPLYMSPEQSMGDPCDQRTDIYSLGCTLFEVLAGRPPFKGATAMETIMMHQNAPIPRLADRASGRHFAEPVEHLVAKMLAKNPTQRYQTMDQIMHDLDRLLEGKTVARQASASAVSHAGGFGTTAETALKASALSGSGPNKLPVKKIIVSTLISCGISIAGALCLYHYFDQSKHKKQIAGVPATITALSDEDFSISHKVDPIEAAIASSPNTSDQKQVAILEACSTIKTESKIEHGQTIQTLMFPKVWLGTVTVKDHEPVTAYGPVAFPKGANAKLKISVSENAVSVFHPAIYQKIDRKVFTDLHIQGIRPGESKQLSNSDASKLAGHISEILITASQWSAVKALTLENLSLKDVDLSKDLAGYKQLHKLAFLGIFVPPSEDLAGSHIFKGVREFQWQAIPPSEKIVEGLFQYGRLRKLILGGGQINAAFVAKLKNYKNLRELVVSGKQPEDAVLDTLCQLRYVKVVQLKDMTISEAETAKLYKNKQFEILTVERKKYAPDVQARLRGLGVSFY